MDAAIPISRRAAELIVFEYIETLAVHCARASHAAERSSPLDARPSDRAALDWNVRDVHGQNWL